MLQTILELFINTYHKQVFIYHIQVLIHIKLINMQMTQHLFILLKLIYLGWTWAYYFNSRRDLSKEMFKPRTLFWVHRSCRSVCRPAHMCIISLFILTLNMLKTLFQCCIYIYVCPPPKKNRTVALNLKLNKFTITLPEIMICLLHYIKNCI